MAKININGTRYFGNSIVIKNGQVIINGQKIPVEEKRISIVVEGDVESVEVDACELVEIGGGAGSVKTVSGDVVCGNVSGPVSTVSGDVRAKTISGPVTTVSGDIKTK